MINHHGLGDDLVPSDNVKAISWTNVNPVLCRHVASIAIGRNVLIYVV